MTHYTNRLIILRGNSGSGKSTIAKKLRERSTRKIAIVEQDYLRRFILKEKEVDDGDNLELIRQTVEFALGRNYHVILEGILGARRYRKMLMGLINQCPKHFVYYFDVSFKESLKRHATKLNASDFGAAEMRSWYTRHDKLGLKEERIIPEKNTVADTVKKILQDTGL
ncbi:MAG: AAA family ATPase [bacterium]|nr:AAA family ATPase [bacterium]